jgi:membrane fusion protein, multidrug efflux system
MKNGYRFSLNVQRGASLGGTLCGLALAVGLGGGAWWLTHRGTGDVAGAASVAPGAAGAGGSAAARRFGGANRVQPVTVAVAQQRDIAVTLSAIGNMAALNTAVVRAKVDGELKAIRFKEGQLVKAGQVLVELDSRTYDAQLAQVQGQLARDQAQLRNAQLDMERYKDLLAKDSIARQQVDTQEALVAQLKGTVQTDVALVDNARLQLSYTKVTAPITGRLGLKQVELGQLVRSGDANGVVTITQTQPIALVFAVPEANLVQINRRLKNADKVPLQVEVWDRELRNRLGQGRVTTTDNVIDMTTGTIKLKAEFANTDGSLFANQFVNVKLQTDTLAGATAVPSNAIQRGAQGIFVYAVGADNTVAVRRVRLGAAEGDWVSVTGDLAPGDKVVTDGADRLREGAKVEVITPQVRGAVPTPANANTNAPSNVLANATASKEASTPVNHEKSATNTVVTKTPAPAPAPTASAPPVAPATGGATEGGADLPPWFSRLPPEMNPDERREFIEKARERRRQREAEGN